MRVLHPCPPATRVRRKRADSGEYSSGVQCMRHAPKANKERKEAKKEKKNRRTLPFLPLLFFSLSFSQSLQSPSCVDITAAHATTPQQCKGRRRTTRHFSLHCAPAHSPLLFPALASPLCGASSRALALTSAVGLSRCSALGGGAGCGGTPGAGWRERAEGGSAGK